MAMDRAWLRVQFLAKHDNLKCFCTAIVYNAALKKRSSILRLTIMFCTKSLKLQVGNLLYALQDEFFCHFLNSLIKNTTSMLSFTL